MKTADFNVVYEWTEGFLKQQQKSTKGLALSHSLEISLKYASELEGIVNCPPRKSRPANGEYGVRFVHDPMTGVDDLPQAKINPGRFPPGTERECVSYGISLFASKEKAVKKWKSLKSTHPKVAQTIGDHLFGGSLDETSGLITTPSKKSGHFTLFESVDFILSEKFESLGGINEDD